MKDFDIRETQLQQLEMLKTLIDLFEQEGLNYFAIGGTALGAIRHKGFIPWDDDIDIAMLRPDYEKFLKIQDKLPKNLFILNYETNSKCPLLFTKVMNNDLPFPPYDLRKYGCPHKVFVDIFPWDNIDNWKESRKEFKKIYTKFRRTIYKENSLVDKVKYFIYKALYGFKNSDYFYEKIKKLLEDHLTKKPTAWGHTTYNDVLEYDDIFPLRMVEFEDTKIFVPNSCEKYLTQKYGDYMTLPKDKDRKNHSTLRKEFRK